MKISQLYRKGRPLVSFEVFPPKKDSPIDSIYSVLDDLCSLYPDYISVTYGAGGTSADNTCAVASRIQDKYSVTALAHITCINSIKKHVEETLKNFKDCGIENVLALRGDRVKGAELSPDFKHASDLIKLISADGSFSIAGACYPEGHPESDTWYGDIQYLKQKVDLGAEFLISQLFFNNKDFHQFQLECKVEGIDAPIEAGIMPITSKKQVQKIVSLCGAAIPPKLAQLISTYGDNDDAMRDAGIHYAIEQCIDLLNANVDGLHLYVMNNPYVAQKMIEGLKPWL